MSFWLGVRIALLGDVPRLEFSHREQIASHVVNQAIAMGKPLVERKPLGINGGNVSAEIVVVSEYILHVETMPQSDKGSKRQIERN